MWEGVPHLVGGGSGSPKENFAKVECKWCVMVLYFNCILTIYVLSLIPDVVKDGMTV